MLLPARQVENACKLWLRLTQPACQVRAPNTYVGEIKQDLERAFLKVHRF